MYSAQHLQAASSVFSLFFSLKTHDTPAIKILTKTQGSLIHLYEYYEKKSHHIAQVDSPNPKIPLTHIYVSYL